MPFLQQSVKRKVTTFRREEEGEGFGKEGGGGGGGWEGGGGGGQRLKTYMEYLLYWVVNDSVHGCNVRPNRNRRNSNSHSELTGGKIFV